MEHIMNKDTYEGIIPVLLREDLKDTGKTLHTNRSPDIIVQQTKLFDPEKQLRDSYDRDFSEDRSIGQKQDYIYVRCRNQSNKTLENVYIHLYRNHLGLYNRPADWQKNRLHTEGGMPAKIEKLAPDEIGVAPVFIYDHVSEGIHPNCFVAVASFQENPDFSYIDSYGKYIEWVNQPNVAARNVSIQTSGEGYNRWKVGLENPGNKEGTYYIIAEVEAGKEKVEMSYGFENSYLGIRRSQTYKADDENTHLLVKKVFLPKGYRGDLSVWCQNVGRGKGVVVSLAKPVPMSGGLAEYAVPLDEKVRNILEAEYGIEQCIQGLEPIGSCTLRSGME